MSSQLAEGNAVVYCPGAFRTTNGKTAHGLVRRSARYRVVSVIDPDCAGLDAGTALGEAAADIPVVANLDEALAHGTQSNRPLSHLVVGFAPDGGRLPPASRSDIEAALAAGLHVVSGMHDYLSDDRQLAEAARRHGVLIRDLRKSPPTKGLHFFSGKVAEVGALKVAVLGTDSAVGKRTTAWRLVEGLQQRGRSAALVGTGQTAWLQGARYGIILDSLVNDFVSGELEHAVWSAWDIEHPEVIVIEGQGSLLHPAYPGGFEILAATRPQLVILQHAPARREYDGFPGHPIHPLSRQLDALEIISGRPVCALALNHERIAPSDVPRVRLDLEQRTGVPVCDVLLDGPDRLIDVVVRHLVTAQPGLGSYRPLASAQPR